MFEQYSALIKTYGLWAVGGASALSFLLILLFSTRYIHSNTEHRLGRKIFDIIMMFVYLFMFAAYLVAGIYVAALAADMFSDSWKSSITAIGVIIGTVAFWLILELKSYIQRTRAEKQKRKRQAAIEAAKRAKEAL